MLDKISTKPAGALRILLVGDAVGTPGINMCSKWFSKIKVECQVDGIVVNGENSAKDGRGINNESFQALRAAGADAVSTGNHVWRHNEFHAALEDSAVPAVRPANFPAGCPGKTYKFFEIAGNKVALVNMMGRTFLKELTDCPFKTMQNLLPEIKAQTNIVLVDIHAEATSEKAAFGLFLDGQVSAVFGTHTHVQTADARVLPQSTAFMTDLGCVAALNSCIGVQKDIVINAQISQMPAKFKVELSPPFVLSGAVVDIDPTTGLALQIQALRIVDDFK